MLKKHLFNYKTHIVFIIEKVSIKKRISETNPLF
jgi:hypothetical protein